MSWATNAPRRDNRRVTGLQHAGGRQCAVTILERVVRSFLEKLTLEQRFVGVSELHVDILKQDSPIRGCSQSLREEAAESEGGGSRAQEAQRGEQQEMESDRKQLLSPEGCQKDLSFHSGGTGDLCRTSGIVVTCCEEIRGRRKQRWD